MKHILVVPGFCESFDSANTKCVDELIKALKKKKTEVVITGKTLEKTQATKNWKKNPKFMLKKILQWPVIDPDASKRCWDMIEYEVSQHSYDTIIVSHMPYDAVLAAIHVKKKHPELCLILYELDPITYEIDKKRNSLGRYLYFLRVLAEKKTYDMCDYIIHMECNRAKFSHRKYAKYSPKSIFLDFPLIHDLGVIPQKGKQYNNQKVRFIYAGKLMNSFRSPDYLLQVIVKLNDMIKSDIFFFSSGDCESKLERYSEQYGFIHQMGYVDSKTLNSAIEACDCLINIGNKYSDMLPSKLLTYIETGKMILHVKNQTNDSCLKYLDHYNLALIIDENDSVEKSAIKIVDFIENNYQKRLGSTAILSEYVQNTPEFSAEKILELTEKG